MELVWNNSLLYNSPGSEIYKLAYDLRDSFYAKAQRLNLSVVSEKDDQWIKTCLSLIDELRKNSNAKLFNQPVDYRGLNLPDYPKVVKKPMDLGTVKKN